MKEILLRALSRCFKALLKFALFEKLSDVFCGVCFSRKMLIRHRNVELWLSTPNQLNKSRAVTFSSKEPETLRWIDSLPLQSILWDIGANVGLYSCYAARARGCRVYAFEPSVFNLETLARNINLNGLCKQITIVPLPLCRQMTVQELNMTSLEWGGALSTFGEEYGHDGKKLDAVFSFQTLGVSMSDVIGKFPVPGPDFIKMDVDGIEHLILQGGLEVLKNVKGILIEINDEFVEQAEVSSACLRKAGFLLVEKAHSDLVQNSPFSSSFNQIWERQTPDPIQ